MGKLIHRPIRLFTVIKKSIKQRRIKFGKAFARSWRWGMLGVVIGALLFFAVIGSYAQVGLGLIPELLIVVVLGLILVGLTAALVDLLQCILKPLPRLFINVVLGSIIVIGLVVNVYSNQLIFSLIFAALFVLVNGLTLAAAYLLLTSRRRIGPLLLLLLTLSIYGWTINWIMQPGPDFNHRVEQVDLPQQLQVTSLPPGDYPIASYFYGRGTDKRRPEFGGEADWLSATVDATPFLPNLPRWQEWAREWFWGFDKQNFPLNGRVWAPVGDGPFPLVLIVHGNHQMEEFSDPGYKYLGEYLASLGYITVSVDQNFLNGSWSGGYTGENNARAWHLLEHLVRWRTWNQTKSHQFYQKVDLDNIALIGHSRGGEAVAIAGLFNSLPYYPDNALVPLNYGFSIRSIIAIAPSDGQYKPAGQAVELRDVNYLTLHGNWDSDVQVFMGQRQYRRVSFSGEQPLFKSAIYIDRANHGQFNTVWGNQDLPAFSGWILNKGALLEPKIQQGLAKTYIASFLQATLGGDPKHRPLFQYPQAIQEIYPEVRVITQYQDSEYQLITDFGEDTDVTTTTLPAGTIEANGLSMWQEQALELSSNFSLQSQVAILGWSQMGASYRIGLARTDLAALDLTSESYLELTLADGLATPDDQSLEVLVELGTGSERASLRLSDFAPIPGRFFRQFTKAGFLEKGFAGSDEPIVQTYRLPLAAFITGNPNLQLDNLTEIRLNFANSQGKLILEEVGFSL